MDEDAENTKILKSWLDTNDVIAYQERSQGINSNY